MPPVLIWTDVAIGVFVAATYILEWVVGRWGKP